MPFSQTMLAVVTSLLAVLTVLVPVISKAVVRERADLLLFIDEANQLNLPNALPRLKCDIAICNVGKVAGIIEQELIWNILWDDGKTEAGEAVFSHPLKERIAEPGKTVILNAELFSDSPRFREYELYKMEQLQTHWTYMDELEKTVSKAKLELTSRYKWSTSESDQSQLVGKIECFAYKRKVPLPATIK